MPYAIVGIISIGLVISSIRTVVVERAHIRKQLVHLLVRKQQKRLSYLKKRIQLYFSQCRVDIRRHAAVVGVSMMVMGPHLEEINHLAVEPYVQLIAREELREARLEKLERWKEISTFGLAILAFTVFPSWSR